MDCDDIDDLTERVIGAAITVHSALGAGLLESIYRDCLALELRVQGIPFETEVRLPIVYRETQVRHPLQLDLRVDGRLIVEIKAVERLHPVFRAQVITYLKLADCPAGLLLNFNVPSLRQGLHRLDHPDIYARKQAEKQRNLAGGPRKRSLSSTERAGNYRSLAATTSQEHDEETEN